MRRALVVIALLTVAACSSTPQATPRERFVRQLQQSGPHRFDQVQVGDVNPLTAAQASCVADAFERLKWPLESALNNKLPTQVDVRFLNQATTACIKDPTTTTIGPFG